MQREDSEGTKTSIPTGEQREVVKGRIQRATKPPSPQESRGCGGDHNPHPQGKSEGEPGGH